MTLDPGSVVLRGGTVLTVDATHRVLPDTDVLVAGDRITDIGPSLPVPDGTREIDATGGIVMPGMIDTHRHMWQTAMRGYGADWTLTQYFVWYYLESGKHFRPQDVHAGQPARRAGGGRRRRHHVRRLVARPADHRPRRGRRRRAAVGARPVRARLRQHPAGPVGVVDLGGLPGVRAAADRRRRRPARLPDGLRRHRRPGLPGARRLRGRPRAGRPRHHARGRLGRHERRGHPDAPRGRLLRRDDRLRPRHDALRRLLPAHRRHRRLGVGGHRERAERRPGLPAHVGAAGVRHPGVAVDGHQRVVERRPVLRHAHAR